MFIHLVPVSINMTLIGKTAYYQFGILHRAFSCTTVAATKQWRVSQGLAENRTSEGVLTDGPDFTYLDGRPTPLLHKQKLRMLKQREYANKIVEFCSELQFAKDRYQKMIKDETEKKQRFIDNRLKPKGNVLLKK